LSTYIVDPSKTNTIADFERSDSGTDFLYDSNSLVTESNSGMKIMFICTADA
jgi:hypothetical protein